MLTLISLNSKPHNNDSDEDDIEKLYDLDNYSEDEEDVDTGECCFRKGLLSMRFHLSVSGMGTSKSTKCFEKYIQCTSACKILMCKYKL